LVRDRHIRGRTPQALALYLLLCTVADAQGVSYYPDSTAGGMLGFCPAELRAARAELEAARLIAYRAPFYQVLSLEPGVVEEEKVGAAVPRSGEGRSVGDILRLMMEGR